MARHAAKELLRRYGRAGNNAFRLAHQEVYGRQAGYPGMGGYQGHMVPGYPQAQGLDGGEAAAAHAEKQSLADEVALLIDKARSNTELLSDMLVNRNSGGGDEFEGELIRDLLAEVEELRSLFTAYLEQLQAQDGPEMEVLMVQALEAADTLDNCIALSKPPPATNHGPGLGIR
ncbi:uncharacterized protein HaLaN_21311 [Haematococcus lacustris]|uniref:Uncharacterized protein n=1 Tax=Haematococcus lacustris TaxID=44745 RepID=A0A699ZP08_HAELA|nr:uncharacterized protein HaLaN_21311 [Haematococcus lacustris]